MKRLEIGRGLQLVSSIMLPVGYILTTIGTAIVIVIGVWAMKQITEEGFVAAVLSTVVPLVAGLLVGGFGLLLVTVAIASAALAEFVYESDLPNV